MHCICTSSVVKQPFSVIIIVDEIDLDMTLHHVTRALKHIHKSAATDPAADLGLHILTISPEQENKNSFENAL